MVRLIQRRNFAHRPFDGVISLAGRSMWLAIFARSHAVRRGLPDSAAYQFVRRRLPGSSSSRFVVFRGLPVRYSSFVFQFVRLLLVRSAFCNGGCIIFL
ncbi:hypothetical protein BVRB_9g209800 [Beta vulgaris subsp. vulgaris]|nr:hypothetical protein BVRB_9g209800 [Beta vulgaris subsp. vulgaris]